MGARPPCLAAVDRLRLAAAVLRRDGSRDALQVAAEIERYLEDAPRGLTLDLALGLSPAPGQTPWWEAEAFAARNRAIRKLRDSHFGNLRITSAARAIERAARRYQAQPGHGRQSTTIDASDDRKRLIGEALSTGLPFPGERQLLNILRNES